MIDLIQLWWGGKHRLELILPRCSHFGIRLKEPGDGHMENDFNLWLATMDRLKVHIALVWTEGRQGPVEGIGQDRVVLLYLILLVLLPWSVLVFVYRHLYTLGGFLQWFGIWLFLIPQDLRCSLRPGQAGVGNIFGEMFLRTGTGKHRRLDPKLFIPFPKSP